MITESNIAKLKDGSVEIDVKGDTYKLTQEKNGNIKIEYEGRTEELIPVINSVTTAEVTTNGIKIVVDTLLFLDILV